MSFVDDDGEAFVAEVGDAIDDEGKLLNGSDDDAFASFEALLEFLGGIGWGDDVLHLRKLFDVIAELFVEESAVSDDDDGIEEWIAGSF